MGLMRLLLALSVVFSHLSQNSILRGFQGDSSVEAFFLISGFYIAGILSGTYKTKTKFYLNRALRLFPIYLIILLGQFTLTLFQVDGGNHYDFPGPARLFGLISNLTLFGTDWIMFLQYNWYQLPLWKLLLVPQAWSLGVEVTFYLFAPLLVKLRTRYLLLTGGILELAKVLFLLSGRNNDPWGFRFFPFELPLFIVGIVSFKYLRRINGSLNLKYSTPLLISTYILVGFLNSNGSIGRVETMSILVVIFLALTKYSKSSELDRSLGELSYPIYISHIFVLEFFEIFSLNQSNVIGNYNAITLAYVIVLFGLSFSLLKISKPIEVLRDRIRGQSLPDLNNSSSS